MNYTSAASLLNDLKKGNFLPVYILHGPESYFIDKVCAYLEKHVLDEAAKAFNMSILYGREVDAKQILDHVRQFPLMSDRRLVFLKEAQYMKDLTSLSSYIEKPSDQTIFVLAHMNKKIDGRSKWLKMASTNSRVGVMVAEKIKDYKIDEWLKEYFNAKNRKVSPRAHHLLAEYLGTDLKKLINEIEKIELNIADGAEITVEDVEKYVGISKDFNVFELLAVLGKKDYRRVQLITDNLCSNLRRSPLQLILPAFFQHFQKVWIIQNSGIRNDSLLAKELRVNPFFIKDYKEAAKNFSRSKVREIFSLIKETDARSKGINNRKTDPAQLLIELVGKILIEEVTTV